MKKKDEYDYYHNLYYLQHDWLPQIFYSCKHGLRKDLMDEKGQLFVDLFHAMHKDAPNYKCPITADDFQYSVCTLGSVQLVRITMPEPPKPLYCRAVYMCYNQKTQDKLYYTSELSEEGIYLMCSWTKKGGHYIYDIAPSSIESEFNWVVKHFTAPASKVKAPMCYTTPKPQKKMYAL